MDQEEVGGPPDGAIFLRSLQDLDERFCGFSC